MDLHALFQAVPPTVLGFIIGSVITVIGVVLTNMANTKRLRIQHEHDREMRSRDRDLNLRKDIYLAAMEAISTGIAAIGRFGELNVTEQELMRSYTAELPSIAKVNIVGELETIDAVATFTQELSGMFMRLTASRQGVNALWQRSQTIDTKLQAAVAEHEQLTTQIRELEATEAEATKSLRTLQKKVGLAQQRIEGLLTEQSTIGKRLVVDQLNLTHEAMEELAKLNRLVVPILSAMRAELGLAFDAELYAEGMEAIHKQQLEYLEETSREIISMYDEVDSV